MDRSFYLLYQSDIYSSTAACAAANISVIILIINYICLDWSTFELRFSCILHILHVDVSYYFARIFILLQDLRSFCKNIRLRNKISLHLIFNFSGCYSIWSTLCQTIFSKAAQHILNGNYPHKHILQTLFAKLIISSDFTFILHAFLAESVCF